MNASLTENSAVRRDEDIDFRELLIYLWQKKWWIIGASLSSLLLAAYYAFYVAKPVFVSSALLIPTQPANGNDLGAAAALLGKSASGTNDIDLYRGLLTSRTVIHKLLNEQIINESDTGKGRTESVMSILGQSASNQSGIDNAVESISGWISVGAKSGDGGIVEVRVSAIAPWLAQQLGSGVLRIGQEEFRLVRIERSKVIMSRLSIAVAAASNEWESAAKALASYKDRNRSISLQDQVLALSRLEIEKQAKEQKYLLVRREMEAQLLDQIKAAPPMMILDGANRPSRKVKPKRRLIILIGLFGGAVFGGIAVLSWKALSPTN